MKILVVMKRFGTNKDMVMENFGRQIRLFENLSKEHKIDFLCMDYTKKENKNIRRNNINFYIRPISLLNPFFFFKEFRKLLEKTKYDAIVPTTTPILGIISHYFAKKYRIKMIYDLQDNFEIYGAYKIPFLKYIDKHITKESDSVLCVSSTLKNKVTKFRKKQIYVVENGVDLSLFRSIPKQKARKALKLPEKSKIMVYIGHISNIKGFDILYEAFNIIRKKNKDVYLLLSGKVDNDIDLNKENIIFKKLQSRKEVVLAINSGDVAVLPNTENFFTKYSFPFKILEYMACKVPIVATDLGDIPLLLKNHKDCLCNPNAKSLAYKIEEKFRENKRDYKIIKEYSWKNLSLRLNKILKKLK